MFWNKLTQSRVLATLEITLFKLSANAHIPPLPNPSASWSCLHEIIWLVLLIKKVFFLSLAMLKISGCNIAGIASYEIHYGYIHNTISEPHKGISDPGRDPFLLICKGIYLKKAYKYKN